MPETSLLCYVFVQPFQYLGSKKQNKLFSIQKNKNLYLTDENLILRDYNKSYQFLLCDLTDTYFLGRGDRVNTTITSQIQCCTKSMLFLHK